VSGETEHNVSGWTVDTLHAQMFVLTSGLARECDQMRAAHDADMNDRRAEHRRDLEQLRALLQERYETQTVALQTALASAEKAVNVALLSAEKAVIKAELASDTRFASVNEFREQLADQAQTFMPRAESGARHDALAESTTREVNRLVTRVQELDLKLATLPSRQELAAMLDALGSKVESNGGKVTALELRVTNKLEHGSGIDEGNRGRTNDNRAALSAWVGVLGVLLAAVSIAFALFARG